MTATIQDQLATLLSTKFGVDPATEAPDASLDEIGMDSLAIVELLLEIQKRLGIRVEEGEILPTHTLAQAAGVVAGKAAQ